MLFIAQKWALVQFSLFVYIFGINLFFLIFFLTQIHSIFVFVVVVEVYRVWSGERVFEWIKNHHRLAQTSAAVLIIKVQSLILFKLITTAFGMSQRARNEKIIRINCHFCAINRYFNTYGESRIIMNDSDDALKSLSRHCVCIDYTIYIQIYESRLITRCSEQYSKNSMCLYDFFFCMQHKSICSLI
jgi:hypothetical protein